MNTVRIIIVILLAAGSLSAQEPAKPRIFVTDSRSWEISGGFGGSRDGAGGGLSGGARPQTAEIMKTFGERCPDCIVTINKDKADYIIILDHEGGKDPFRKDNKFALFNKEGDAIKSGSTRVLGNAVKEACEALTGDWKSRGTNSESSQQKSEGKND
ncbi:MAG: hypothetical protein L0229_05195 [Blastocatellia bacterium]|nr:hypothetical protein [Blastocatellia bacterium]